MARALRRIFLTDDVDPEIGDEVDDRRFLRIEKRLGVPVASATVKPDERSHTTHLK